MRLGTPLQGPRDPPALLPDARLDGLISLPPALRPSPGVSSVGITAEGPLDFAALNGYMMRLLQTNARDIYRSKGVLCFEGQGDTKFVFQGVHEQIAFGPSQATWAAGERRVSKMVFIGRNLNRDELEKGFRGCLAKN